MKSSKILTILTILVLKSFPVLGAEGGSRGGGGHSREQDWTVRAFEMIEVVEKHSSHFGLNSDQLKALSLAVKNTYLRAVNKISIELIKGRKDFKEAAFERTKNGQPTIHISPAWEKLNAISQVSMTFHEYLGVLGIEVNRYDFSQKMKSYLAKKSSPHQFVDLTGQVLSSTTPILLHEQSLVDFTEGTETIEEAQRICQSYKQLFKTQYFYIYCAFHGKTWSEVKTGLTYYTDYRYLGDRVSSGSAAASASGARSQSRSLWGISKSAEQSQSLEGQLNHFRSEPVTAQVQVPFQYEYEVTQGPIYGLRIFGLGDLDGTQTWKTLFSSENILSRFNNTLSALVTCSEHLLDLRLENITYHRGRCVVEETDDHNFIYQIKTLNPFVSENEGDLQ